MGDTLFWMIGMALVIVPLWRICGRAGFNPALSLIAIVPWLGFLIVAAVLGFSNWPVQQTKSEK